MMNVLGDAYILGNLLGSGGMGTVYAAEQRSLGRAVAIKLMHPHLVATPMIDRFRIEAIAGSRLSHPNVAGVVDFGTTQDGIPFLVMARVAGETLGRIVQREGALPLRRSCGLVLQILAGLGQAHAVGVVHADVKSDNVIVESGPDGDIATLIDFGIARLVDHPEPSPDDACGDVMLSGTPEYLAPEVIGGQPATALSDLYAVGIILYELVTGATPFAGGSPLRILQRQLDEEVVAPGLPSVALERVLLRALTKDPAQRFPNAATFARAIREVLPDADVAFESETPTKECPVVENPTVCQQHVVANPRLCDRTEALRADIGDALASGCLDDIAASYLLLVQHLVELRSYETAVWELAQAIDILTLGDGPDAEAPPPQLWRVLLAQAALFDGVGDPLNARRMTLAAERAAARVGSATGRERALVLRRRLVRGPSEPSSPPASGAGPSEPSSPPASGAGPS